MNKWIYTLILGTGFMMGLAIRLNAQIVGTTGQVTVLSSPPASVVEEALESNNTAYIFEEHANFVLPINVNVDATLPGTYNSTGSLTPGTIPAGTPVNIYFLHSDTVDESRHEYIGTITFAQPILGVLALKSTLDPTDSVLGAPGTLYPVGSGNWRGLEFNNPDHFRISADSKTLWFRFNTFGAVDQIRILTVPEPGSLIALGTALASLMGLRARRRQA